MTSESPLVVESRDVRVRWDDGWKQSVIMGNSGYGAQDAPFE